MGLFNFLFAISVTSFGLGIAVAILLWAFGPRLKSNDHGGFKAPWAAAIGIFVAVVLYSIIESYSGLYATEEPLTQTLLLTLETFTFARDISSTGVAPAYVGIHIPPPAFYGFGNTLYLAASITTLGTIIALASKRLTLRTLRFTSRLRETYVFSRVNEQAITLAISIRDDNLLKRTLRYRRDHRSEVPKKCQIIFADANLENDRLLEQVRSEGFKYIDTVTSAVVTRCRCRRRTHLHIILTSENEIENLHEGIELSRCINAMLIRSWLRRRLRTKPTLHVFASSSAAESYVDRMVRKATKAPEYQERKHFERIVAAQRSHMPSRAFKQENKPEIRRIDWTRNVVQQMLVDYPLFLTSPIPKEGAESDLQRKELYTLPERRIVIVGAGHMGYAFLKGALWCGQSTDVKTFIDVIDKVAKRIEQRLKAECPGLFEATDGNVFFRFLTYDVNSAQYLSYLKNPLANKKSYYTPNYATNQIPTSKRITYMLFALDDDLQNTEAAKRTREVLESCRLRNKTDCRPFIAVVVDDKELAESIWDIENSKSQSYDLVPVGDESVVYSYQNLFCPDLEDMGVRLNAAYWGYYEYASSKDKEGCWADAKDSYDTFEYNRRSSRAAAAFLKYHLYEFCRLNASHRVGVRTWAKTPPLDNDARDLAPHSTTGIAGDEFKGARDAYDKSARDDGDATASTTLSLMRLEHLRWNAYMRTEGFQCCDERVYEKVFKETEKDQHQLARLHICLAPFDELPHVDEWDASTQKSFLTDKARAKGLLRLVKLLCRPTVRDVLREDQADERAAKALEDTIRKVTEEEPYSVCLPDEDVLVWFDGLKAGTDEDTKRQLDMSKDVAIQIVGHVGNQSASDNGDPYVRLLSAVDTCAKRIIDEYKRGKPFQHNDLAIIRNLRSIVCGA